MTRIGLLCSFLFFSIQCSFAQLDPVKWTAELTETENGIAELVFTAKMDDNWVLYSQHTDPNGPVPTTFLFDNKDCLDGEVLETSPAVSVYSDLFMLDVIKFKKESIFVQKIKTNCGGSIKASVEFMTCDGERCLPPKTVDFEFELN